VCDCGAEAVLRYVVVSGESPSAIPEYFVAPIIFDRLGDRVTFTVETSARTLMGWHNAGLDADRRVNPDTWAAEMKGWRVDLIAFEDNGGLKSEMPIFALIEMKKNWFSDELHTGARSDLDKLGVLLKHITSCRYGLMAAWLPGLERDKKKERALKRGDAWIETPIRLPPEFPQDYYFCGWLLEKGKGSMATI